MSKTPLILGHAIAAGIEYPLMYSDHSSTCSWDALYEEIGIENIVKVTPWQPLHTTIVRELKEKQFTIAKRCMPPLDEVPNAIVKDYVVYKPKDEDYDAIVQRIDIPIFREAHDVIAEAFNLREHYRFELHVTLERVKKGEGERCLAIIEKQYQAVLATCEVTNHYFYFKPDGSWVTHEGWTENNYLGEGSRGWLY